MPRTKAEKSKLQRIPKSRYITRYGDEFVTFHQIELYHSHNDIQAFDEFMEDKDLTLSDDGLLYIPIKFYHEWLEEKGDMHL